MKRQTAYKLAIEALEEKQRRQYVFDYNAHLVFPTKVTLSAYKNFVRIDQAIEILGAEKDYRQITFGGE